MKSMSITALAIAMAFASGCGPSVRERFDATERLLRVWNKSITGSRADYVRILISEGADVNSKTKDGDTPLLLACERDHLEIATLLIEKGADVNARDTDGRTPLMMAAVKSTPEIVQLLIEKGAEVNAKMDFGWTPLMQAAQHSYMPEIVQLLLEKGADVNAKNDWGSTPTRSRPATRT